MKAHAADLEKDYPIRGPLHQFRFRQAQKFRCFRCGQEKISKLITIYSEDWSRRLCNGCYGYLLSIYELKRETKPEEEKAAELGKRLLDAFNQSQLQEAVRLLKVSEKRSIYLSERSTQFLATAEYVSKTLSQMTDLDWSSAVIGLCKAVEMELVLRLIVPLQSKVPSDALKIDMADRELMRVAKSLQPASTPPELGSIAHFLQVVIRDEKKRNTSPSVQAFLELARKWPNPVWVLDSDGLPKSLKHLASSFRNRAAHLEQLTQSDYDRCRELVVGTKGILWQIVASTTSEAE